MDVFTLVVRTCKTEVHKLLMVVVSYLYDALLNGIDYRLGPIFNVQFVVNVDDVIADRSLADIQHASDLTIAPALRQQP